MVQLENLFLVHHFQSHDELGSLLPRKVDMAEFASPHRFSNFEIINGPFLGVKWLGWSLHMTETTCHILGCRSNRRIGSLINTDKGWPVIRVVSSCSNVSELLHVSSVLRITFILVWSLDLLNDLTGLFLSWHVHFRDHRYWVVHMNISWTWHFLSWKFRFGYLTKLICSIQSLIDHIRFLSHLWTTIGSMRPVQALSLNLFALRSVALDWCSILPHFLHFGISTALRTSDGWQWVKLSLRVDSLKSRLGLIWIKTHFLKKYYNLRNNLKLL